MYTKSRLGYGPPFSPAGAVFYNLYLFFSFFLLLLLCNQKKNLKKTQVNCWVVDARAHLVPYDGVVFPWRSPSFYTFLFFFILSAVNSDDVDIKKKKKKREEELNQTSQISRFLRADAGPPADYLKKMQLSPSAAAI